MAWTDYSNTESDQWAVGDGASLYDDDACVGSSEVFPVVGMGNTGTEYPFLTSVSPLSDTYNIPGFEDGYYPEGVVDPINGSVTASGGGGGSTRPASGMLYPRGQS